jgi:diguanylate cyclase (GGDEF)-like protein
MNAQPAKILVADDEPGIRQLLRAFLERAEFQVVLAQNGDEAVRLAQENVPDVIVVDVMMPQMDGYEVCRQLRNDTRTSHVPILMLTSRSAVGDKITGFESGADDYVTKPFDLNELVARIRSLLRRAREATVRNPLTGLPGNRLLQEEIKHRLQRGDPLALLYVDMDNFKALNDAYGFVRGDQAIQLLAQLCQEAVQKNGGADDFIGHIGGDDFAIITTPDCVDKICTTLIERFDAAAPALYDEADTKLGYLRGYDRSGVPHRFPLMTISIGVVTNRQHVFASLDEISRTAADMKRYAKQISGSSYAVDQRGNVYTPGSGAERRGRTRACQIAIAGAEEDLLELLQLHMGKAGYRVRVYCSGQDLLAAVRAATPAVVVVDAEQKDGSAWDLCRELREVEGFQHHPILLLSTDAEDEERAFRLQIDAFLQKPFSLQQFSDCVQDLVAHCPTIMPPNGVQDEDSRSGG